MNDTLFAHARTSDPETSHAAAASIPSSRCSETQDRIMAILRIHGPLTDHELIGRFRQTWPDSKVTDQRIRTSRSDLTPDRVRFAGTFGDSPTGRINGSRKWEVVDG